MKTSPEKVHYPDEKTAQLDKHLVAQLRAEQAKKKLESSHEYRLARQRLTWKKL